jgi:hypothetical protein
VACSTCATRATQAKQKTALSLMSLDLMAGSNQRILDAFDISILAIGHLGM